MTKIELDGDRVFLVSDFLMHEECAGLIRRSEELSYEVGMVGGAVAEDVRNNERVVFDDPALAADIFARARPFLPAIFDGRPLVGFNERWRFYRYGPGQAFKPHRDGEYVRIRAREASRLTFMIYLNDHTAG
jgi:prolyl 4-hydroxylase